MSVQIPVRNIAEHFNPFKASPWGVRVTRAAVLRALTAAQLEARPNTPNHVQRTAYLVQHPSPDPIEIDVGAPVLGYYVTWMILDGNHRLAAAIYRGDDTIQAAVSGQLNYAHELFGVDCEETAESLERACRLHQESCG